MSRPSGRNGAQLLELGKEVGSDKVAKHVDMSQWSPAFRAGKSSCGRVQGYCGQDVAMEPSF